MEKIIRGSSLQLVISGLEIDPPGLSIDSWAQAVTNIQGELEVLVDSSEFLIEEQFTFLELVDAFQRGLIEIGFGESFRFESGNDDVPGQLQIQPLGEGFWSISAARQRAQSSAVVSRAELERAILRFKEQSLGQVEAELNVDLSMVQGRPAWIL